MTETSTDTRALEATVARLTARAPRKLFDAESNRGQERFEAELARQLARLEDNEYGDDVASYLGDIVFYNEDGDDVVVTDAYVRNAGMASGYYVALKALRLPSGASVYYSKNEFEGDSVRGLAAGEPDDEAAAAFGDVTGLPTSFYAGDYLLELDKHMTAMEYDWIGEALLGHDAEWMDHAQMDAADQRRSELQQAIDDSWDEGDVDDEQLGHAQETLDATPPWFLLLTDTELEEIAANPLPEPGRRPRLCHKLRPWTKPTAEVFLEPDEPANLQHIVAAYLVARWS